MLLKRVKQSLEWNVVHPITDHFYRTIRRHGQELLYQNIFQDQCRRHGLQEPFYPLGAAANYSLMYLVCRLLEDFPFQRIIELGSGQTTILIDQVKDESTAHIVYEHEAAWHKHLGSRLQQADYRLRPLATQNIAGRECRWYDNVELSDFDFLLVDGPYGVTDHSRLGALKLIENNSNQDFLVVLDDTNRPGEDQTSKLIQERLRQTREIYVKDIVAMKTQTVICTEGYRHATFF